MIDKDLIYNSDCLVILSSTQKELLDAFEYTYGNVFLLDLFEELNEQIEPLKKSNFRQIIFVDYYPEYDSVISRFINNSEIKIIFTKSLGAFSDLSIYNSFNGVIKLFNEKKITKVGFIDTNLYLAFKNKINCCTVSLDIERKEYDSTFNNNRIGLLNSFNNARNSYYNELSALTFNNYTASLEKTDDVVNKFLKLFNIKSVVNKKTYMDNNLLNLYINFTDNNFLNFIMSMDRNVPCIIGNNDILSGTKLEKYLVVDSDDSIDEISDKIEFVKTHRKNILKEYKIFRDNYSKKCIKEKEEFLGHKTERVKEKKYDILLSIVVPVWNTKKYIKPCLESIITTIPKSLNNKFEILIINDGSDDNPEEVIDVYLNKYDFVRYFYQKNSGLGSVRNLALKNARGKYIASVDSDDTINANFFSDVYKAILKDVDVFVCDFLTKTDTTKYETAAIEYKIFDKLSTYEGILYSSTMPSTCNKVFKKSLYEELDINYYDGKFEDLSANPFVLWNAKKIMYVRKPYYEYYLRSNSLNRTFAGENMIKVLKLFYERLNKYKNYCNIDIEKFKYYTVSWRIESYIFNQLYELDQEKMSEMIKYLYDNFYDEMLESFKNKYYLELLNSFDNKKRTFFIKRNEAFKNKKLEEYIKGKKLLTIDSLTIYYGENKPE